MKRAGLVFTMLASLGWSMAGCGGGLTEGPPPDATKSSRTPQFEDTMKNMGPKMGALSKGKPKDAPKAEPTKEK